MLRREHFWDCIKIQWVCFMMKNFTVLPLYLFCKSTLPLQNYEYCTIINILHPPISRRAELLHTNRKWGREETGEVHFTDNVNFKIRCRNCHIVLMCCRNKFVLTPTPVHVIMINFVTLLKQGFVVWARKFEDDPDSVLTTYYSLSATAF